jgi:hypothetical protein
MGYRQSVMTLARGWLQPAGVGVESPEALQAHLLNGVTVVGYSVLVAEDR